MQLRRLVTVGAICLSQTLYGQTGKVIQPEDLLGLKTVNDAQISPDGREILFVVNSAETPGERRSGHIWIVSADGTSPQRPFIFSGNSDTSPRWSPDGKSIAFLSVRPNALARDKNSGYKFTITGGRKDEIPSPGPEKGEATSPMGAQVWIFRPDGGEAEPLTNMPGGVKNFSWLPDGKSIAFLRRDQDPPEEKDRAKKGEDWHIAQDNHVFDRLWVYDLAKKEARLVTKQNVNVNAFAPSPDGSQFLLKVSPTPFLNDFFYLNKTILVDAATGEEKKVLTDKGGFAGRWSANGKYIVLQEHSEKGIAQFPSIYNFDSGARTPITFEKPTNLEMMDWDPDSRHILAFSAENTHVVLQQIDVATGKAKPVALIGAANGGFTVSGDRKRIAYICSRPDHPGEVCSFFDNKAHVLTENNPQVAGWKLGKSEEIEWKSSQDGLIIHGLLVYPADYVAGKKYKTVVQVHGGPIEGWFNGWNGSWYNPAQFYASHGYAVFLPMVRGSSGSGPAFEELNYRKWGTGDFPDLMDGVDSLVGKGVVDPDRMVIGGWSYGGYMTAWAITHTHRFKAAMVGAGISDIFSDALTTDIAPTYLDGYFGAFPTIKDRKVFDDDSPISFIDQVTTPTLLLHGESDVRVPTFQGLELYNGLRFLGKDVMMVTYPREPHIFTEYKHQVDSLNRMLGWYDKHVQ